MPQKQDKFIRHIADSYGKMTEQSLYMGTAIMEEVLPECHVKAPLKMFTRHGLVAGATGTGKTRTLQTLAEKLSDAGVPSLLMDMKGDLSGMLLPGDSPDWLLERAKKMGDDWEPCGYPVTWLGLTRELGAPLRTTVSELGPVLLSRLLDLSETQSSVLSVIFRFCDDEGLLLVDFKDMTKVFDFIEGDGKEQFSKKYGDITSSTLGVLRRKFIALESESSTEFFSEPSFDVNDLLATTDKKGRIHLLHLAPVISKPAIFTTFLLALLAEIFEEMPEVGEVDKPKLVIFIDEAHLIFRDAPKTLLEQLELTARLIRSKGVGLVFCSQRPDDIPESILSQLGFKIQHALRAFTAKDRAAMKKISQNFPLSDFIDTEELLSKMGTGEALMTFLNEKGVPTELVHTLVAAPRSLMTALDEETLIKEANSSPLYKKYSETIDSESAYEILSQKIEQRLKEEELKEEVSESLAPKKAKRAGSSKRSKSESSILDSKLARDVGRTMAREVSRGILGAIGLKTGRKSSSLLSSLIKKII